MRIARAHRSQTEFAVEINIRRSSLSEIETGRANASLKLLTLIATTTGATLDWLITGEGPMRADQSAVARPPLVREIWRDPREARQDPDMWTRWVPVIGYLSETGLLDHPSRQENENLDPYLRCDAVPEGSVSVRLLQPVAGFARDSYLIFGPVERAFGAAGFGLFHIKGEPNYFAVAWRRHGKQLELFPVGKNRETLPRVVIMEYRSFFGSLS